MCLVSKLPTSRQGLSTSFHHKPYEKDIQQNHRSSEENKCLKENVLNHLQGPHVKTQVQSITQKER